MRLFDLYVLRVYFLPQELFCFVETWWILLVWHFALLTSCRLACFVSLPWILEYICALTSFALKLFVALHFFLSFHSTHSPPQGPAASPTRELRHRQEVKEKSLFFFPFSQENQRISITSTEGSFLSFCVPMSNSRGRYNPSLFMCWSIISSHERRWIRCSRWKHWKPEMKGTVRPRWWETWSCWCWWVNKPVGRFTQLTWCGKDL